MFESCRNRQSVLIIVAMVEDSSIQRISRLTPLSAVLALIEAQVGSGETATMRVGTGDRAARSRRCCGVRTAAASDRVARRFCRRRRRDRRCQPLCADTACIAAAPHRCRRAVASRHGRRDAARCRHVQRRSCRSHRCRLRQARACCPRVAMPGRVAPLRRAGERLRVIDIAVMAAAGIEEVTIRAPRIAHCPAALRRAPPLIDAALTMLARVVTTPVACVLRRGWLARSGAD